MTSHHHVQIQIYKWRSQQRDTFGVGEIEIISVNNTLTIFPMFHSLVVFIDSEFINSLFLKQMPLKCI